MREPILCKVSGECPDCHFIHQDSMCKVIQADGKILYNLKDAESFGFAQCSKCNNVMPWKKQIIKQ